MIKLSYQPKPSILTTRFVKEKTAEFIAAKEAGTKAPRVWNKQSIKDALLKMSHHKCCYCECSLNKEGQYMEIEHFEDKSTHPHKVLDWLNLLPSCKRCNLAKGTYNVNTIPIIHPVKDTPSNHIYFRAYCFRGKTVLGKTTIKELELNDPDRLQDVRYQIGKEFLLQLENALESLVRFDKGELKKISKGYNQFVRLLKTCLPQANYSATKATLLFNEEDYQEICSLLKKHNHWTQEIDDLIYKAQPCILSLIPQ
ncbi:MAG: HNH endonuclease [Aureispira sp.]